jgi:hypothetical protein
LLFYLFDIALFDELLHLFKLHALFPSFQKSQHCVGKTNDYTGILTWAFDLKRRGADMI